MKRILILLIALAMLMTACGQKSEQPAETQPEQTPAAAEVNEPQNTETPAQPAEAPAKADSTISEDDFVISSDNEGNCVIENCSSDAAVIEVPETIAGNTVVGIGASAFSIRPAEKIILPDTVRSIDTYAFNSCDNLTEVVFGSGLKEIGAAFILCPELRKVSLPEGVTTIKDTLFTACDNLEEAYIPASATEIAAPFCYTYESPNLVIVTPAGSVAESVANEAGIPVRNS